MSEIRNLTRNGETFYPQTHVEGVLDPSGNYIGNYVNNPEWIRVICDSERKILAGIKSDGSIEWSLGVPQPIKDYINENIIPALLNKVDKVEGKSLINSEVASSLDYEENPEFMSVEVDSEDKVLGGRKIDGTKFENVGLDLGGALFKKVSDPEDRSEVKTDDDGKVLSYRGNDGILHEKVGLNTEHLILPKSGMKEFQRALEDAGLKSGGMDYTDKSYMEIPMPRCAYVNITSPNGDAVWPNSKTTNSKYYMEFYDGAGNFFKKEIIFNAQGNSSMAFVKKNGKADFCNNNGWDDDDTFVIKIGDWVAQDSFHFKSYYTDFIRGGAVVAYQIADEAYKTRGVYKDRPWKQALIDFSKITPVTPAGLSEEGVDDLDLQIDNGARCMPDGFPAIFYLNGEFYGIFSWQLSKNRDNYHMNKKTVTHIHLDGDLYVENFWGGTINWTKFEVRNPKSLYCMDGSKYDGDSPQELIDSTSEYYDPNNKDHKNTVKVKQYIINLSQRVGEINTLEQTSPSDAKALFDTYFDADNLVDYQVINMAVGDPDGFSKNWQWITYDGIKWYVCQYDKDMSFGNLFTGQFTLAPRRGWINSDTQLPCGLAIRYYEAEHKERWNELVSKGIFTSDYIISLINLWVARIGRENFNKEWKKWPIAPCNRDSAIDFENWDFTGRWVSVIPEGGIIWQEDTEYQQDTIVWIQSSLPLSFRARKTNINKPPVTKTYSVYPSTLGYRDSVWRYCKYVEQTMINQQEFINSI